MPSAKRILALLVPALAALVAALAGSPLITGVGVVVALGVLAFQDRTVPRPTRWLLRAGLVLLGLAEAVTLWVQATSDDPARVRALVTDPAGQRTQEWRWSVGVAACLVLACVLVALALRRLPGERLSRMGLISPMAGALTLAIFVFLGQLASALLGEATELVLATVVALIVCGLFAAWMVRRDGIAAVTALGTSALAVATFSAVLTAWMTKPQVFSNNAFLEPGLRFSVPTETGPDIGPAIGVMVLLTGAALTVLTCVRLSTPKPPEEI